MREQGSVTLKIYFLIRVMVRMNQQFSTCSKRDRNEENSITKFNNEYQVTFWMELFVSLLLSTVSVNVTQKMLEDECAK